MYVLIKLFSFIKYTMQIFASLLYNTVQYFFSDEKTPKQKFFLSRDSNGVSYCSPQCPLLQLASKFNSISKIV